ncbi:hypothetical protein EVB97_097 [Rhizobium phage RHph_Y65]|uniref:Uncharacterized protein n=1 Tax=Rhizobium phage RHph_Y65 TaxID=2509785 RepID=A0A7S5RDB9_9CAUD|nr:hypothetical protein PQC17_gp097 [Rhizobium phage RHph_Y65]QIG72655.1 hypothetical protein EVB97_097 [Rhizobium phage RHph_Y65]
MFYQQIPMGAGDHSSAQCFRLTSLLHDTLNDISTLQQAGGRDPSFDNDYDLRIKVAACEIFLKLTGYKISDIKLLDLLKEYE